MANMSDQQLRDLLAGVVGAIGGGAAGGAAATMAASMGPCILGKNKLKRPKKWSDWIKAAENKMSFSGIEEGSSKWEFIRSCAGPELTEVWEKEVRIIYKTTADEQAHTYEQVLKETEKTLYKLVSRDRAVIELFRMDQGTRTFSDFLAEIEDQTHLCHSSERLTEEDLKRIGLLAGIKDRSLAEKAIAEDLTLKQIIQAATNRESSKINAEAIRSRPTSNVNRLEEEER